MPSTKNIAIFVAIATVFVLIYLFFFRDSGGDEAALVSSSKISSEATLQATTSPSGGSVEVGDDFLALLLSVKSIKLDDTIFSSRAFATLNDSSITLVPDGNEGRSNPFAPFGVEEVVPPAAASATVPSSLPSVPTSTSTSTPAPSPTPTTPATPSSPATPSTPSAPSGSTGGSTVPTI